MGFFSFALRKCPGVYFFFDPKLIQICVFTWKRFSDRRGRIRPNWPNRFRKRAEDFCHRHQKKGRFLFDRFSWGFSIFLFFPRATFFSADPKLVFGFFWKRWCRFWRSRFRVGWSKKCQMIQNWPSSGFGPKPPFFTGQLRFCTSKKLGGLANFNFGSDPPNFWISR